MTTLGKVLLVGLLAVAASLVGLLVGGLMGTALCNDDESDFMRCLDDGVIGAQVGFVIGAAAGTLAAALLLRRLSGRRPPKAG